MKLILKIVFIGSLLIVAGFFFIDFSNSILIESIESKTSELGAVFNKIKLIKEKNRDIWMMNQSHYGKNAKSQKWDRIVILVEKTKRPYMASFFQLTPGELEWNPQLTNEKKAFRASCFLCHNNGPRAIKALPNSLSIKNKINIFFWNLRIKSYGRVVYNPIHDQEDKLKVKKGDLAVFRHQTKEDNDELKIKTCMFCHNNTGFLSRGVLFRQQRGTIKHLVENNEMPPLGFSLTVSEKQALRNFIRGF